ncbi:ABC transporter permease [Proteinivorax hydrogeniformans]|uniref:ABC transporter permease n=1 Tax=Proteinivorax hydrogeniformans TaxID=1826727 RepID=A0AAU8HW64_9FIRM
MSFFNRAMLSVGRRKSKNLTMLVIMTIILSLVVVGMNIIYATENASVLARETLGSYATLSYDFEGAVLDEKKDFAPQIVDGEEAALLAEHENVLYHNSIGYAYGVGEGIEVVGDSSIFNNELDFRSSQLAPPNLAMVGVDNTELLNFFDDSYFHMSQGRHLTFEDKYSQVAVIEQELANKNNLTVGDTIEVKSADNQLVYDLEIVGIYQAQQNRLSSRLNQYGIQFSLISPSNRIYVPYDVAVNLRQNEVTAAGMSFTLPSLGTDRVVYYIDEPQNVDVFIEDSKQYPFDWQNFKLDANERAYRYMVEPAERVASLAKRVILITVLAGICILSLVLMLWVKERNYETGVLLSLGESKKKIIYQYLFEMLVVAVVAIFMAFIVGGFASQHLGNRLMDRQFDPDDEVETIGQMLEERVITRVNRAPGSSADDIKPIDQLQIGTTFFEKLKIMVLSLGLMTLAVLVPMSNLMRYSPKSILSRGD